MRRYVVELIKMDRAPMSDVMTDESGVMLGGSGLCESDVVQMALPDQVAQLLVVGYEVL